MVQADQTTSLAGTHTLVLLLQLEVNNIPFCDNCDLKHVCNGGCRINNVIATGSYNIPLCSNDYKLQLYEKLVYKF